LQSLIATSIICNVIRHASGACVVPSLGGGPVVARIRVRAAADPRRWSRELAVVEQSDGDEEFRAFLKERAEREGDAPLTAEDFACMAGDVEVAYRLAWLKRLMSSSATGEGNRPPPR
jgi:hypothetical protein